MEGGRFLFTVSLCCWAIQAVSSEICFSRVCEFDLVISAQMSHVYRPADFRGPGYFDVDLEGRDLRVVNSTFRTSDLHPDVIGQVVPDPLDVITLDGVRRLVITVNGQFPAPTLEVVKDSQVVVRVKNELLDQGVTLHWHGLPQRANPWMDGVPDVTQCVIPVGRTFTYRFTATPAGTFWYHSHVGYQRFEGLAGMLLIHEGPPTLPYFPVLIQDWYHEQADVLYFTNPLATPSVVGSGSNLWAASSARPSFDFKLDDGSGVSIVRYISGLIQGRGRFMENDQWPLTIFEVQQNQRYLFKICNVAAEYPLQVSIDSHKLKVTSVDGLEVQPVTVDSVILYPAERADIEVMADQPVSRYWMRSRVLKNEEGGVPESLAIVSYTGSNGDLDPDSTMRACTPTNPCTALNCPFAYFPPSYNTDCIHMQDVKRTYGTGERSLYGLDKVEPDIEHFLNLQFFKGINFNANAFASPTTPLYQTDSKSISCDSCPEDDICLCTFRLALPFNKTIQLVFSNIIPGGGPINAHPVHIHGHHFAVVRMGFANYTPGGTTQELSMNPNPDVVCNNQACRGARWAGGTMPLMNLVDPPLKDTMVVPASGYTVVRFRSDNPGPWLVHCHMIHHSVQGPKAFLLIEAEDRFPPIPPFMPTCARNFTLTERQFEHYLQRANKGGGFRKVSPHAQPYQYPPPSLRRNPNGIGYLGLGGTIGVLIAGLVGGVLLTVTSFAICRCCRCRPRSPHRKNNIAVAPLPRLPVYGFSGAPRLAHILR